MIRYLKHGQIDKAAWDECVTRSLNRRVYAFSWYLDCVSPGWDGLVEDGYNSIFPLTWNRKAGINYLFQPFFTQQLGLFSKHTISHEFLKEFLDHIPSRFYYIDIHLNTECPGSELIMQVTLRINNSLNLELQYNEIAALYSRNTRRNLQKAEAECVNTGRNITDDDLIRLFRLNFGAREKKLRPFHYERLKKLMDEAIRRDKGEIRGAYDDQGLLSAAAFFLKDEGRIYFLFAASDPVARENGAMFRLIDDFIREHAGNRIVLDFEGGNDADLGRFYKSFGSSEEYYFRIIINRLPFILKPGLVFVRMLRKSVKQRIFVKL